MTPLDASSPGCTAWRKRAENPGCPRLVAVQVEALRAPARKQRQQRACSSKVGPLVGGREPTSAATGPPGTNWRAACVRLAKHVERILSDRRGGDFPAR